MSEVAPSDEAVLEFDHNVIEHLGIRLYQNKIANVLAELVANSWDADATQVEVLTSVKGGPPLLAVRDTGTGMDYEEIKTRYLVIGKPKRKSPKERSPGNRPVMGRKGIGKLAPFGVARQVDVITVKSGLINWFSLRLSSLLDQSIGHSKYKPPFTAKNEPLTEEWRAPTGSPFAVIVDGFLNDLAGHGRSHGTMILMSDLTTNRQMTRQEVVDGLINKFTIVLARPDFKVLVDGILIDATETLPEFELRIPTEQGFITEQVDGRDVKYWVGFVGSAKWSSDQAGIGVFVHGKIGQDRPFYFGAKGKEIFQRYIYGVVEADWLDELDHDLVSTDRTSIDWADPAAAKLREWGASKVLSWLETYASHRSKRHFGDVSHAAYIQRVEKKIPTYSKSENQQIDQLVAEATRDLGKGAEVEQARDQLLDAVSKAWMNLPSRRLVTQLWKRLSEDPGAGSFGGIVHELHEHSVPEAMGLALTFAQRAYALSVLTELIHRKSETKLQTLIEQFPWILQPRGAVLTANQWLKTTIEKAATELENGDVDRAGRVIQGMKDSERADFVFLADVSQKRILIAEIKAPNIELSQNHRRQLGDYLDFVKQFHSSAEVSGLLVGRMPSPKIEIPDTRIEAKSWDELLIECRSAYVELLASMLEQADPDPNDTRIQQVFEFGGKAVWELLTTLSQKDERLSALMLKHNELLED